MLFFLGDFVNLISVQKKTTEYTDQQPVEIHPSIVPSETEEAENLIKSRQNKIESAMSASFKSRIIILITFWIQLNCFSAPQIQQSINSVETIDSLKSKIEKLDKTLAEGSYTRIPNKDFESLIDNKIQRSMRDTLTWWFFVGSALISILGFLVIRYTNTFLQSKVDAAINQLKQENEDKIERTIRLHYSTVVSSLIDFKKEKLEEKKTITEEEDIKELIRYLKDESIILSEDKKVKLIDTIIRSYYKSNFLQRIEKMIALIKEYEDKFIFLSSTYINAALAFGDMFERYGSKDYLNSAIENCNKSIKILPDYGLAFAQKLELYSMAITKAFDDDEKKIYENELLKIFKEIDNNSSTALCRELIDRLEIDKNYFAGTYIDKLYHDFAIEMGKITARASSST